MTPGSQRRRCRGRLPFPAALWAASCFALPALTGNLAAAQGEDPLRIDLHSHPSRFHRANVPRISDEEIARYLDRGMDAVVATISTDTPYRGGYVLRDGTRIESGNRRPDPPNRGSTRSTASSG